MPSEQFRITRSGAAGQSVISHHAVKAGTAPLTPGDFLVTHGTGIYDQLIRWATRSNWNHAALIVGRDGTIIEALGNGVKQNNIAKYNGTEYYVVRLDMTDEDRAQVCAYAAAMNERHEHYGWATIVSIVLRIATKSRLIIKLDGTMICSELVAKSLAEGGRIWYKDTSLITPADLYNTFVKPKSGAPTP